jgi:predicted phage tail protein
MLKEIRLYGKLAKFIGQRVLHADVATAAEAIRFLLANWPEVEQHMADNYYKVCVGNTALDENEVVFPIGQEVIKIIPVVAGAKNFFKTAFGKILAGIALIALAVFAPVIAGALAASMSASVLATVVAILPTISTVLMGIGVATVLGGVASLLTPVPKMGAGRDGDSNSDPRKSYSFSGIQNTSRQGTPCQIVFGEALVGSIVVSAGIDVVQVAA